MCSEKFEDANGLSRNCKSKKDRQHNGQKEKRTNQRSIKRYTDNQRSSNTNPTRNRGFSHVFQKNKQFLFHMWHPSCYSCYKLRSWMRTGPDYDYDKLNISVVICDRYSAYIMVSNVRSLKWWLQR